MEISGRRKLTTLFLSKSLRIIQRRICKSSASDAISKRLSRASSLPLEGFSNCLGMGDSLFRIWPLNRKQRISARII